MDHNLVTTAFELPGCRITRNYGIVRGIIVRSRSLVGNIGAAFQQLAGGNITLYTNLCEKARTDAYELMIQHAQQMGANEYHRCSLRCHRNFPGRHRSSLLRHGCVCRTVGVGKSS